MSYVVYAAYFSGSLDLWSVLANGISVGQWDLARTHFDWNVQYADSKICGLEAQFVVKMVLGCG